MASFVGKEEDYNGIFSGIATIFRENGILGFWSGLMPRVLGEAIQIGITAGLTYAINKYVDNNMKAHTSMIAGKNTGGLSTDVYKVEAYLIMIAGKNISNWGGGSFSYASDTK